MVKKKWKREADMSEEELKEKIFSEFLEEEVTCLTFRLTNEEIKNYLVEWHGIDESEVTIEMISNAIAIMEGSEDWLSEQYNTVIQEAVNEVAQEYEKKETIEERTNRAKKQIGMKI